MRQALAVNLPWISVKSVRVLESVEGDTFKVALNLEDGCVIESVLLRNARDGWTACMSTQVGCAMHCTFCATGTMGLTRNLLADEIVDQYRFWISFLQERNDQDRLGNLVLMGMGEPLANYENVREALNTILKQTDVGPTHITVSTVGILPRLEQLLTDPSWPAIRIAISLHSADAETRKKIIPSSYDDFLPKLRDWAKRYLEIQGNRRHHLTFEYVLLRGINDSEQDAKTLADYAASICPEEVRINLIPYHKTGGTFDRSKEEQMDVFRNVLERRGITATCRRSMGEDIQGACGQLATEKSES